MIYYINAKYIKGNFKIAHRQYPNGRIAVVLRHADGTDEAVATVNLPDTALPQHCVWLKGWSENEGLPEALEKAGIVQLTPNFIQTGFTQAQMARLL